MNMTAYLARLGLPPETARRNPDLDLLQTLMSAHLQSIPFENLDVLLGQPIELEPPAIFDKLVTRRRGGYCFEHNGLFEVILEELGFFVTPLAARIRRDSATLRPHTHKILRVDLQGQTQSYLVDVGFGAEGPRQPMPFTAQGIVCGDHRLHYCGTHDLWVVHLHNDSVDLDLYAFELQRHEPIDFVMYNHFTSTYPKSNFVNRLAIYVHTPGGHKSLVEREFVEVGPTPRKFQVDSRDHLTRVLADEFGLLNIDVDRLSHPTFN